MFLEHEVQALQSTSKGTFTLFFDDLIPEKHPVRVVDQVCGVD